MGGFVSCLLDGIGHTAYIFGDDSRHGNVAVTILVTVVGLDGIDRDPHDQLVKTALAIHSDLAAKAKIGHRLIAERRRKILDKIILGRIAEATAEIQAQLFVAQRLLTFGGELPDALVDLARPHV